MTLASALASISGKIVAHTFHSGIFMFVLQHPTPWDNGVKQNFMWAVITTQPHMSLVCRISKPTTSTHRKLWSANKPTPPCVSIAIELFTMKWHVKYYASMQCQWRGCCFPWASCRLPASLSVQPFATLLDVVLVILLASTQYRIRGRFADVY